MATPILSGTKSALNKLLRYFGQKLVSIERPTRSFTEFFDHLKSHDFVPTTILDVGAASGTLALYSSFPAARFILVEALHEFEPALRKIAQNYNCEIHMVGVGADVGTAVLNLHQDPYGSYIEGVSTDAVVKGQRQIKIATIFDLLDAKPIVRPALAKFDIQGYELEAIRGMRDRVQSFDVYIIETSLHSVSANPPDLYSVVSFMKQHGYSVYDILDGILRPMDGDLAYVDLVFVKDDGPLRRNACRWC
jgi:FkbM family methyltransferase